MTAKKYRINLTPEEQQELEALVSRGRVAAYKQTHARILLMSDEAQAGGAMKDDDIARALHIGRATVERIRRGQKKLDGQAEAHLIALACTEPPQGRTSWTLKLLAERLVACSIVERISTETVRRTLKKLVLV